MYVCFKKINWFNHFQHINFGFCNFIFIFVYIIDESYALDYLFSEIFGLNNRTVLVEIIEH